MAEKMCAVMNLLISPSMSRPLWALSFCRVQGRYSVAHKGKIKNSHGAVDGQII